MLCWPLSKSPHMCHGKKATWDSRFNNSGTEITLNVEALCCLNRTESTKEHIFHFPSYDPQGESQLSRDPALFSCSPSQHDRCATNFFLSKRVRTLWILFLYTFTSRLKAYAIPNPAVRLHQCVSNSKSLNVSRIGLSPVLIIKIFYIVMITRTVISYSITFFTFISNQKTSVYSFLWANVLLKLAVV